MGMLALGALLAGCGDKEADETGGPGLVGDALYPSETEVLVYSGNGGADGDGGGDGGVEAVSARWEGLGYTVRTKDEIPSDLEKYRAIVMMAPGYFGGAALWPEEEVDLIARAHGRGDAPGRPDRERRMR